MLCVDVIVCKETVRKFNKKYLMSDLAYLDVCCILSNIKYNIKNLYHKNIIEYIIYNSRCSLKAYQEFHLLHQIFLGCWTSKRPGNVLFFHDGVSQPR